MLKTKTQVRTLGWRLKEKNNTGTGENYNFNTTNVFDSVIQPFVGKRKKLSHIYKIINTKINKQRLLTILRDPFGNRTSKEYLYKISINVTEIINILSPQKKDK